jgi:hypothetical protein
MSVYKMFKKPHGVGYVKDGKIIKNSEVPELIKKHLSPGESFDDATQDLPADAKRCVFCDEITKMSRLINTQTIYICEPHYYDKTIGQVAAQVRLKRQEGGE